MNFVFDLSLPLKNFAMVTVLWLAINLAKVASLGCLRIGS